MIRTLLALILAMASPALLAAETPAPAAAPGCEQTSATTTKPAATVVASAGRGPAAESSVRPRQSRGGPRWQSLLPGMIR
jgi:hypothetical protein